MVHQDLPAHVRSLVAGELGSGARPLRIDVLQESARGVVLRLQVAGLPGSLVLTLTGRHPGRSDATEPAGTDHERVAAVVALARAAGVPVPRVLAARNGRGPGTGGYLLREHVNGAEWHRVRPQLDADAVRSVHRRLAETLLAIQSVTFGAFGELDKQGRPAGMSCVQALHRRVDLRVADAAARDLVHSLLDGEAASFAGVHPTLVHDDLHHGNVVLSRADGQWRVAAVLDWEKAWAGPGESDVARMAFWDGMTGPGFWEVYRAAVPEDDGFPRRALVHQLLWCLEYDVQTARHRADTAAVCGRLGVVPPSRGRPAGTASH